MVAILRRVVTGLGLVSLTLAVCAQTPQGDADLARGIRQVEEGDLEGAVETLVGVVRRLSGDSARTKDLAQAHLYLGVAYALQDQEKAARGHFREGLERDTELRLDPARFSRKALRAFEAALQEIPQKRAPIPLPEKGAAVRPELFQQSEPGQAGLGVTFRNLSSSFRRKLDLPDLGGGVIVEHVFEGSSGSEAGLQKDDVIRKIEGVTVRSSGEMVDQVSRLAVSQEVRLEVWRGPRPVDITAKLMNLVAFYQRRCEDGSATACCALGERYQNGRGVPKDDARAIALFQKACDGGSAEGCDRLGRAFFNGQGVAKDSPRAAALLRQACEGGYAFACGNLGALYRLGEGVNQDEARAIALFQQACDGGDTDRCGGLAERYERGEGVATDLARAATLYQQACDGGMLTACSNLGVLYSKGEGVAKDEARAATLYQQACDGGDAPGCENLGRMYLVGAGVALDEARAKASNLRAVMLYQQACDKGQASGCHRLAMMYLGRLGVARDDARAKALIRRACELGLAEACR